MTASKASLHHRATAPSTPHQQPLPTGPIGIVYRAPRTPEQIDGNRAFLSDAGRVEFGRHDATLQSIWMAFAYFASLSDERTCYATLEHLGERARRSSRTVSATHTGARRSGPRSLRQPAGRTHPLDLGRYAPRGCPGRADRMSGQGGHDVRRYKR